MNDDGTISEICTSAARILRHVLEPVEVEP